VTCAIGVSHARQTPRRGGRCNRATAWTAAIAMAPKPTAAELLKTPGAMLSSTHLKELGWSRNAIDAIWRSCPMVVLPGFKRPMLRIEDYLGYLEEHTYRNEQPRVSPPYQQLAGSLPNELARRRRSQP
jgi:hypothetical protein